MSSVFEQYLNQAYNAKLPIEQPKREKPITPQVQRQIDDLIKRAVEHANEA